MKNSNVSFLILSLFLFSAPSFAAPEYCKDFAMKKIKRITLAASHLDFDTGYTRELNRSMMGNDVFFKYRWPGTGKFGIHALLVYVFQVTPLAEEGTSSVTVSEHRANNIESIETYFLDSKCELIKYRQARNGNFDFEITAKTCEILSSQEYVGNPKMSNPQELRKFINGRLSLASGFLYNHHRFEQEQKAISLETAATQLDLMTEVESICVTDFRFAD